VKEPKAPHPSGRILKLGVVSITNSAGGGIGTLCTQLKFGVNEKLADAVI
jgi:hypothetical protein